MQATVEQLLEQLAAARDTAEALGAPALIAMTECALVEAHQIVIHEGAVVEVQS